MVPTPSARLFDARLRLIADLRRIVRAFDGSDALTIIALAAMGAGLYLIAGPGWALLLTGFVVALMTPIGTALRLFVRGR